MSKRPRTILDLESLHLEVGSHTKASHQMCVMEAVAFVAGEPWSDSPECASPVIAAFLRSYNDSVSDEVRQTLKAYIPRLIGTRGSAALEERRGLIAADWLVRVHTPAWLRLAGLTAQADALASLPEITSMAQCPSIKPAIDVARQDAAASRDAAWDASRAACWTACGDASWAACWAAAGDASWTASWTACRDACGDASWTACRDACGDAAWAAVWDAAGAASWTASRAASWTASRAACRDALKPTVDQLQATVPNLIERMLAVTEEVAHV
jgi:hypothetical protein